MKFYSILHYPTESYEIVENPIGGVWDLRQAKKVSKGLCKMLNGGIIQDRTGSHRILDKIL